MSLFRNKYVTAVKALGVCLAFMAMAVAAFAQNISTTTVQGTVYLANGSPGSGTLQVSWPAFTTASNQAVAAGKITTSIGGDGFVSVNLAPNLGSSPAGLYYTAIYHMSDGTTSTEYWVVPAAAQASIAQVRSQVMPAAQALQAVSKAYVDQAIQSVAQGNLTSTGGQLTGPLYLTGDPTQSLQAADKHYVDGSFAQAVPLSGGVVNGPLTAEQLGAAYQVDQFSGADFGAKLQACLTTVSGVYGGTCDARNFSGNLAMAANLTISTANTTVMLPCATISTASQIIVTPGTRNVSLRGCSLRGASNSSGSQGGTVLLYSGSVAAIQVGDPTYAADTNGFHLDNVVINTTTANSASAQALAAYRTQEMDLESLYVLGNANQTGMTLDGTGNYTGGTFYDNHISGFETAINGIGHQVNSSAATDWLNASAFVRLHIDCPTASGNPIAGTYGVNLQQGDGNTFTGGDVENCGTAVHLGPGAQNNTILGLRNENSTYQVVADGGSSYNSWMTGGTMFTGKLTDNGTRNSFLDTFHRSFNSLNGDWYGSQQDATLTNHLRLGIGSGNERGLLDRYQTDYGYRWTMGLSDATGGEQFYQVLDELNGVYRLSIGQYNNGQSSSNNQTVINSAGTGAVVLNGSNNAGTGGVVFGSGGANESTVATVGNTGNAEFNGALQVGGTTQSTGTMTVRNNADAEVDYYLWPGLTTSQKGSFTYKDYNGNSQWYMVKDASNNWALNSAIGGLDSFKAYQSTNSGDTYINASNASGAVRVNYETGAGSTFNIYGGSSSNLYASFSGNTSIKFPGLSASSGHNCLQIDSSGYITNSGAACGTGSGSGTVNSGSTGQIAYYNSNGTAISGMSSIPVAAGGTGATTAAAALAALGGVSLAATTAQNLAGPINASINSQLNVMAYGAKGDCSTNDSQAFLNAQTAAWAYIASTSAPAAVYFPKPPGGCYIISPESAGGSWWGVPLVGQPSGSGTSAMQQGVVIRSVAGYDVLNVPDPTLGIFNWFPSWSIKDISLVVNNSVPPINNTSHRWTGRWFDDGAMTAGSNVFTSSNAMIGCGDIGQAIQVNGAGPGGGNLVTTIASVSPCWANNVSAAITSWRQVTLAANASTTVTGAHSYIAVIGQSVTSTIGNCAIAMDDKDANPVDWVNSGQSIGSLYPIMDNVAFSATNSGANQVCNIFSQGRHQLYGINAQHFHLFNSSFGVVQAPSELNSYDASSSGDFETWEHGFSNNYEPWVSYNGGGNTLRDWEITADAGPQILGLNNEFFDIPGSWLIDISEFEAGNAPTTYGMRITGNGHAMFRTELAAGNGMTAILDTTDSDCACYVGGGSTIQLYGQGQRVHDIPLGTTVLDSGRGNAATGINSASPLNGLPYSQTLTFLPSRNRPDWLGGMYPDFLADGNPSTPYKAADLWIWPQDFEVGNSSGSVPYSTYIQVDSSSLTGYDFIWPAGFGYSTWQQFTATSNEMVLGTNMPQAPATVWVSLKCPTGINQFSFHVNSSGGYVGGANNVSCTTSLATYKFPVNFAGQTGYVQLVNAGSNPFYAAWVYVQPNQSVNGVSPTGAGAALTTGPTSSTPNDLACYGDTAGTGVDCGTGTSTIGVSKVMGNGVPMFLFNNNYAAGSGQYATGMQQFAPNATAGSHIQGWTLGYANSANNEAHYQIDFAGNGSASNVVSFISYLTYFYTCNMSSGVCTFPHPTSLTAGSTMGGYAIATANQLPLTGTTGSIGGSALTAGQCTSGAVNVTGATTSMGVVATPATYPGDGMHWLTYVSSSGVVTVKVCAVVSGTPTASTYNVRVIP